VLEEGAKNVEKKQGKAPKKYKDIREALQDKNIDAVTIATPNHWHSLAAVWACQAGKDVYVENRCPTVPMKAARSSRQPKNMAALFSTAPKTVPTRH